MALLDRVWSQTRIIDYGLTDDLYLDEKNDKSREIWNENLTSRVIKAKMWFLPIEQSHSKTFGEKIMTIRWFLVEL